MSLEKREAFWTCDESEVAGPLYYFAPIDASPPPYLTQRHVEAIIDIASDGTLAGVELVFGNLPPPPKKAASASAIRQGAAATYAPGSFGYHEALHMAAFLAGAVDDELCAHGAVLADPEFKRHADAARDALQALYQAIGEKHL